MTVPQARRRVLLLVQGALIIGVMAAFVHCRSTLDKAGPMHGVVRSQDGTPLPSVWVMREGDKAKSGIPRWTRTDLHGRFTISRPPVGPFTLRLVPGTVSLSEGTLFEADSDDGPLEIVLDPGPMLEVKIMDFAGSSADKQRYARVLWKNEKGRRITRHAPIDPQGRVLFVGVPGDTLLECRAVARPGRPVHALAIKADSGLVEVRSMSGETITGTVLLVPGEKTGRVHIRVRTKDGVRVGKVTLKPSGAYEVSELPPGTYVLDASFSFGAISSSAPVEARASSTGVDLDLRTPFVR